MHQNQNLLKLFQCIVIQSKIIINKVLFTFVQNKQFGQLINILPHSLMMMNTINTEFSVVEVWFTDQVSKALEIEDNVNLVINIG